MRSYKEKYLEEVIEWEKRFGKQIYSDDVLKQHKESVKKWSRCD